MSITRLQIDDLLVYDSALHAPPELAVTDTPGLFSVPQARDSSQPRTDADGSIELTTRTDVRSFSLEGFIRTLSWSRYDEVEDELRLILAQRTDHTLITTRNSGRQQQLTFRVVGAVDFASQGPGSSIWQAPCRAADPLLYGMVARSIVIDPLASAFGGFTIPLIFPLDLGGTSEGVGTVSMQGTALTRPLYTVQGPWVNPTISNLTNSLALVTQNVSLGATDTLQVDTRAREVLLSQGTGSGSSEDASPGVNAPQLVDWSQSDWPLLSPGDNLIRAGGSPQTGASLTVSAFDAWL